MKNPKSTRPSAATPYQTAEVTQETRVAETPTPWISHRVVTHCIDRAGGLMPLSSGELIEALKEGLPVQELDELQDRLNLPMDKLVPMLGISKATCIAAEYRAS